MNRPKNLLPVLVLAFAIETLSVTWALKIPGAAPLLSILYCSSGLFIGWLLTRMPTLKPGISATPDLPVHFRLIIAGLITLATWSWCQYWFDEIPIDITNADMLPIIG